MYDQQKFERLLGAYAADIVTAADPIANARWAPGTFAANVRRVFALITVANTVAPTILTFKHRPTPGSASGEVTIATLTIPIDAPIGNVYYKNVATEFRVNPGSEVVVQTDGGGTAGTATLGIVCDPVWEHPGNNTKMVASA